MLHESFGRYWSELPYRVFSEIVAGFKRDHHSITDNQIIEEDEMGDENISTKQKTTGSLSKDLGS